MNTTSLPAVTPPPPTPGPPGRLLVSEITDKAKVRGIFLVSRKVVASDKNGKCYLSLLLSDRSGQIDARVFDNAAELAEVFDEQDHVRVAGTAKSFQGRLQLHLQKIERAPEEEIDPGDYVPVSRRNGDDMWTELQAILDTLADPDIARLLRALFDDPDVAARFRRAPAAKSIHHAWIGGLLEHNLSVHRVIVGLCDHYERETPGLVDRDLCIAGGLLHDFGKIYELSTDAGAIEYTHEGQLIGHLVQCSQKLAEVAATLPGFPRDKLTALQHIVLAHHDRLEFGSPKRPMTAEAMVVHAADQLDSRLAYLQQLRGREPGGWSSYQKVFDRPFHLPRR